MSEMADGEHCQVCHREPSITLPFHCHRCARDTIYEPRLELAKCLLTKESLCKEIEAIDNASRKNSPPDDVLQDLQASAATRLAFKTAKAEYRLVASRTQTILDDSRRIQEQMEELRTRLDKAKIALGKKKRGLKAARQEMKYDEDTSVKALKQQIATIGPLWDKLHLRSTKDRHMLPRELVSLYGLQMRRRKTATGNRDSFSIVGVPIFNLKDLNNASPEHLNVSTYHVAHLIHLAAHYLGLRLPAEISLATAGQPHSFIHTPMSSYKTPSLSLGGSEPTVTKSSSRRRTLWLEKPLPLLASEDSQAYSLYLDAIILLAWDVAWVAKTQGIDVGGQGWEDICLVGKNLWDLFGEAPETKSTPIRQVAESSSQNLPAPPVDPSTMSQASAHSFLNSGGPGGAAEQLKSWRYSAPTKIIETIKSALMNERMGADWEVLEKPEEEEAAEENNGSTAPSARPG